MAFVMSTSPTTSVQSVPTDSSSNGIKVAIFVSIFLPIQVIFVSLRYYSRRANKISWGFDDLLVLVSLLLQISIAAIALGMTTWPCIVQMHPFSTYLSC
jgi:hypothetical protein